MIRERTPPRETLVENGSFLKNIFKVNKILNIHNSGKNDCCQQSRRNYHDTLIAQAGMKTFLEAPNLYSSITPKNGLLACYPPFLPNLWLRAWLKTIFSFCGFSGGPCRSRSGRDHR